MGTKMGPGVPVREGPRMTLKLWRSLMGTKMGPGVPVREGPRMTLKLWRSRIPNLTPVERTPGASPGLGARWRRVNRRGGQDPNAAIRWIPFFPVALGKT